MNIILSDHKFLVIKLFALRNGWNAEWLVQQQSALESLYDREFTLEEAAIESMKYSHYPNEMHSYLNPVFLEYFFKPFAKIESIVLPNITAIVAQSPYTSPKVIEKSSYQEAWKYHAQKLVLMKDEDRLDYLFEFVPQFIKDIFSDYEDKKLERRNKIVKRMKNQ